MDEIVEECVAREEEMMQISLISCKTDKL